MRKIGRYTGPVDWAIREHNQPQIATPPLEMPRSYRGEVIVFNVPGPT